MIKILLGGSPCTFWSIAQKNNRETEAEGLGWELFKNYLIAKEKFKPDFFLYENNKSAAQAIKNQIAKELGADLMYINSSLVSAQNRQRFYVFNWEVEQPEDRGILLRDILETGEDLTSNPKSYCLTASYDGAVAWNTLERKQRTMIAEPINTTEDGNKARTLMAGYYKYGVATILTNKGFTGGTTAVAENVGGAMTVQKAMPQIADKLGYMPQMFNAYNRAEITDKAPTLSTGSMVTSSCAVNVFESIYAVPEATKKGYAEIAPGECVDLTQPKSKTRRGRRMAEKSNCLTKSNQYYQYIGKADNPIYPVKNGKITIKGKEYPIKLTDGEYYIRKLTPVECERLQTLPDGYTEGVSNSQRYKALGNGWTAEVIIHILQGALKDVPKDEEIIVLSMYDGIATGRYCLDKMGFTNVKYFAYEIDKYAKEIAMKNYPDIIQMGDAFQLRHPDWTIGY